MGFGEFHKFLILVLEIPQMEIKPETVKYVIRFQGISRIKPLTLGDVEDATRQSYRDALV